MTEETVDARFNSISGLIGGVIRSSFFTSADISLADDSPESKFFFKRTSLGINLRKSFGKINEYIYKVYELNVLSMGETQNRYSISYLALFKRCMHAFPYSPHSHI